MRANLFIVAMAVVLVSAPCFGKTLRIFNDSKNPIVASVVSGDTIATQYLPALTWLDFELKEDRNDRVLILRSESKAEDGTTSRSGKVIATKTINTSESLSGLIVAWLHGKTESDIDMFCIGGGNLLPVAGNPISDERLSQIHKELHSVGKRLSRKEYDSRL